MIKFWKGDENEKVDAIKPLSLFFLYIMAEYFLLSKTLSNLQQ